MRTTLLCVGRTDQRWLQTALADYVARIKRLAPFECVELPDVKGRLGQPEQCRREGEALLAGIDNADHVVALDEHGPLLTSEQFAQELQRHALAGRRRLVFVVGGPYGLHQSVKDRANQLLALSPMTFSHQMVRLIFAEQLYRAHTIIKGLPYHHGDL